MATETITSKAKVPYKGGNGPNLPGKHGNIHCAKGDARDDIRDISQLVDQLGKPGAASFDDGITQNDTQQGSEKGGIEGQLDGIPGSLPDPRVEQTPGSPSL